MTLRVLSITQLYPSAKAAGEGVFIHRRLRHLPSSCELKVWHVQPWFPFLRPSRQPAFEAVDGVAVERVPFPYVPRLLKSSDGPMLLRALRRRSTDGVDVLDAHFAYPTGWAAVRLGQERGIPTVVTMRGTEEPYSRDPARRRRVAEAVRGADRVVAVSSSLAELAVELGASADRVQVIGNGIDPRRFQLPDEDRRRACRAALDVRDDARVLLTVGGLVERKGVGRVIDVLPRVLERYPEVVYLVAGGGGPEGDERQALQRRAAEHGVADRVTFLGPVPPEDLPRIYQAADVFVLATRNEGWANALHEAIASGLPAVATDVGGNREVLGDGVAGVIVPFGDAAALAAGIEQALGGSHDRARVAEFGGSRTWSQVGEEAAAALRSACEVRT